ncbi:MAG: hypothetical protein PHN89_00585 [Candidatus Pacebacteria bacterium]|nr:hypothetical protein [Candidatus Paceibacterota bacterium]
MRLQIITTFEAEHVAAYESAIITARKNGIVPDTISIWKQPNVIYVPKFTSIKYFDKAYSDSFGFPIVRSPFFPASPTSAVVVGNTWGLLCAINKEYPSNRLSFEDKFTMDNFKSFLKKRGIIAQRFSNDLILPDKESKIAGIVSFGDEDCYYSNSFLNAKKHDGFDYDLFYKLPESKMAGKKVKSINERIATIYGETGIVPSDDDFVGHVEEYLTSIGISFNVKFGLSEQEQKIFDETKDFYRTEKYLKHGNIESIADPMEAFQMYASTKDLDDDEDKILISKFKNKLPTAENELKKGIVKRNKI